MYNVVFNVDKDLLDNDSISETDVKNYFTDIDGKIKIDKVRIDEKKIAVSFNLNPLVDEEDDIKQLINSTLSSKNLKVLTITAPSKGEVVQIDGMKFLIEEEIEEKEVVTTYRVQPDFFLELVKNILLRETIRDADNLVCIKLQGIRENENKINFTEKINVHFRKADVKGVVTHYKKLAQTIENILKKNPGAQKQWEERRLDNIVFDLSNNGSSYLHFNIVMEDFEVPMHQRPLS